MLLGQREQPIDVRLPGDVGRDRRHLRPLAAQLVERRLIDVAGHEPGAGLEQGLERDPADPGAARGQHHPLAVEPELHRPASPPVLALILKGGPVLSMADRGNCTASPTALNVRRRQRERAVDR